MENYLAHIGVKERSGRYPYGSGEDPFQRIKRSGFSKNKKKKNIQKEKQDLRQKPVHEMTDKELDKRTERLRKEITYEQEKAKREAFNAPGSAQTYKPSYYGKTMAEMTNDELKAFVTRMDLEQQYVNLTKKPEVKKGHNWLTEALIDTGKQSVKSFISGTADYGTKELVKYVTGQKKKEKK